MSAPNRVWTPLGRPARRVWGAIAFLHRFGSSLNEHVHFGHQFTRISTCRAGAQCFVGSKEASILASVVLWRVLPARMHHRKYFNFATDLVVNNVIGVRYQLTHARYLQARLVQVGVITEVFNGSVDAAVQVKCRYFVTVADEVKYFQEV